MVETFKPSDEKELETTIAWAVAEQRPLDVFSLGSKRGFGRPLSHNAGDAAYALDVSGLAGIVDYQPAELVLTARPGTSMAALSSAVANSGQMLAFEPIDFGPVFGECAGGGSLGGVVAANLSGPRRIKAGAARDHVLGFRAVSGRGELFKSGGKVVKNVTGYDLSKLMTGSFGTLAVMSEITLKVLPVPEKTYTLLLFGLDAHGAVRAMTTALNSPHEVSGAAHLPEQAARVSTVDLVAAAGVSVTAIRLEGVGPSVKARCAALRDALKDEVPAQDELHTTRSLTLWSEINALTPLVPRGPDLVGIPSAGRALWRISTSPSRGGDLVADLSRRLGDWNPTCLIDWGGGLIHLAVDAGDDGHAATVRGAVGAQGHATLVAAPDPVRALVDVFHPEPPPLAALTARVKTQFDPHRVLNPGRMYAGI